MSLDFAAREAVGLVGDNGAGKSALINILSGLVSPDEGEVMVKGGRVEMRGPKDAMNLGIETVYQYNSMVPNMSIARDIFIGRAAAAIHFKSKVMILDEPTNHLSVKETNKVIGFVRLLAEQGVTAIFISHNMHHVFACCDRVVAMALREVVLGRKIADTR